MATETNKSAITDHVAKKVMSSIGPVPKSYTEKVIGRHDNSVSLSTYAGRSAA